MAEEGLFPSTVFFLKSFERTLLLFMQVDGLTRLMLGAASEDKEKAGHRKENRRETWAPGLGKLTIRYALPSLTEFIHCV